MKRRMKTSAVVVLVSGCLLALSAGAAPKEDSNQCVFSCTSKANKAMEACTQACPSSKDPSKKEAVGKCYTKCADKLHASTESCTSACPKPKPAAPPNPPKTPSPAPGK